VEEVLKDGLTVCSIVVRFALPEHVTSAAGLELLFEPENASCGFALVVKSEDAHGDAVIEPGLCCSFANLQ
jgi:hypothetical protein